MIAISGDFDDERRARDAERKREESASRREVIIPPCADPTRRELLEEFDDEWLRYYFGEECSNPFWYDFTEQQRDMIAAIQYAILYGGDQAIAASRGEGKTTLVERLLLKYTLQGKIDFSVLFSATGTTAENSLESIKSDIADNDRLCEDYPEVCIPVRALENTPNRAHYQVVTGKRHDNGEEFVKQSSKFSWCGSEIVLPNVPGSPAAGAIIATRGLDAAVRGLKKRGKRPKLAVIDDPDTEDTSRSEEQAAKLEARIDKGIGGLGGQQRGIARVMLTTLQSRISASYKFTDPMEKPTWKGRRFRFLLEKPERIDLWEDYVAQRQAELHKAAMDRLRKEPVDPSDEFCRRSHQSYLDNRAEMDRGAVVANPNRFDATLLPDGSQMEVSALQRYFNEVSRIGPVAVATELDNDPPEESGPVESGITPGLVQRQVSGIPRGVIPPDCVVLSHGIDVGKWLLHWVVRAWTLDGSYYTIDYGTSDVHGAKFKSDEGLDRAIHQAVLRRIDEFHGAEYRTASGGSIREPITMVDSGYRTDAVYAACIEAGIGVYPIKGFGQSHGCAGPRFTPEKKRQGLTPGDRWKIKVVGQVNLVEIDADHWKAFEHDRWTTATDKPGCMLLFGERSDDAIRLSDDQKQHLKYAHHICAEVEVEEPHKGGIRRRWKTKAKDNHYLDASAYASVGASIKGIRLPGPEVVRRPRAIPVGAAVGGGGAKKPRMTMAEMAAMARGRR